VARLDDGCADDGALGVVDRVDRDEQCHGVPGQILRCHCAVLHYAGAALIHDFYVAALQDRGATYLDKVTVPIIVIFAVLVFIGISRKVIKLAVIAAIVCVIFLIYQSGAFSK